MNTTPPSLIAYASNYYCFSRLRYLVISDPLFKLKTSKRVSNPCHAINKFTVVINFVSVLTELEICVIFVLHVFSTIALGRLSWFLYLEKCQKNHSSKIKSQENRNQPPGSGVISDSNAQVTLQVLSWFLSILQVLFMVYRIQIVTVGYIFPGVLNQGFFFRKNELMNHILLFLSKMIK